MRGFMNRFVFFVGTIFLVAMNGCLSGAQKSYEVGQYNQETRSLIFTTSDGAQFADRVKDGCFFTPIVYEKGRLFKANSISVLSCSELENLLKLSKEKIAADRHDMHTDKAIVILSALEALFLVAASGGLTYAFNKFVIGEPRGASSSAASNLKEEGHAV